MVLPRPQARDIHAMLAATLIMVSGLCWIAAFGVFGVVHAPMLLNQAPSRA